MEITTREQWLKERNKGIGGSDAAAILGQNPYMSNVDLWKIKTGRMEQEDISENPAVKFGIEAEQILRDLFALDHKETYQVFYKPFDLRVHPQHSCLVASLDGELEEKATGRRGLLEIKTGDVSSSSKWNKWNDRIPDNYFVQILHCMNVCGFDFVELYARLKSEVNELKTFEKRFHIERDDVKDDLEYLQEKELEFWEKYVLADVCPPLKLPQI